MSSGRKSPSGGNRKCDFVKPFEGRVILLTGASSGVGRHLARMLAAEGAYVVCCARRADELANLVAEIESAGGKAGAQVCDVADAESIVRAFDAAEAMAGPVDSVVCNAGINVAGPAHSISAGDFDRIVGVNLRGAFLTAQQGAKRMIACGPPSPDKPRRIVFIASILGRKADPGAAVYSATKAGVLMLTQSLALEWARHGINVNSVMPGYMPTEIVADWFATDAGKAQMGKWPRSRLMPVEDLDPVIRFLLSAEARSVSGAEIVVDDAQRLG